MVWLGTQASLLRSELIFGEYPPSARREQIVQFQESKIQEANVSQWVQEHFSPAQRSRIGIVRLSDPTACVTVRSRLMQTDLTFRSGQTTTTVYVQYGRPEDERQKMIQLRRLGVAIDEARPQN